MSLFGRPFLARHDAEVAAHRLDRLREQRCLPGVTRALRRLAAPDLLCSARRSSSRAKSRNACASAPARLRRSGAAVASSSARSRRRRSCSADHAAALGFERAPLLAQLAIAQCEFGQRRLVIAFAIVEQRCARSTISGPRCPRRRRAERPATGPGAPTSRSKGRLEGRPDRNARSHSRRRASRARRA